LITCATCVAPAATTARQPAIAARSASIAARSRGSHTTRGRPPRAASAFASASTRRRLSEAPLYGFAATTIIGAASYSGYASGRSTTASGAVPST